MRQSLRHNSKALWIVLAACTVMAACGKDKDKPGPDPNPNPPGGNNTAPVISSFAPATGMPGGEVKIQGQNFKDNITQNTVTFTGTTAPAFVVEAKTTELTVRIPQDATTGRITVKVGNQSVTTATNFVVDPNMVAVTDFTPASGPIGTLVTITGINFGLDTRVKINGVECTIQNRNSNTGLTVLIPVNTNLTKHKFELINNSFTVQTTGEFTVTPNGPYARWESKNNTPIISNNGTVFHDGISFVHKNKIYWGFTSLLTGDNASMYAVFDPAQPGLGWDVEDQFSQTMAPGKLFRPVAVVHNDRVFFGTGMANNAARRGWWEFDPETRTSTPMTDFPHAVTNALSFVFNNKIYVGFGGGNNTRLYEFNPAGNGNLGSWDLRAEGDWQELNSGNALVFGNEVILGRTLPQTGTRRGIYRYTGGTQFTRLDDFPQETTSLTTPAFTLGNKGYFIINKNVWEYTPSATGGSWRAVLGGSQQPTIKEVAMVTVNGAPAVYGWSSDGALYEFKF